MLEEKQTTSKSENDVNIEMSESESVPNADENDDSVKVQIKSRSPIRLNKNVDHLLQQLTTSLEAIPEEKRVKEQNDFMALSAEEKREIIEKTDFRFLYKSMMQLHI